MKERRKEGRRKEGRKERRNERKRYYNDSYKTQKRMGDVGHSLCISACFHEYY